MITNIGPPRRRGSELNNAGFALLLDTFVKMIAQLNPGQRAVVSGGWAKKQVNAMRGGGGEVHSQSADETTQNEL